MINDHVTKYNAIPSKDAIKIALEKRNLGETEFKGTTELLNLLKSAPEDLSWLVDTTEKYCQEQAMYNALSKAIEIQTNAKLEPGKRNPKIPDVGAIPELMQDALSVTFDTSIGHDWFEDYEKRWLLYQSKAMKIPFSIPILNKITKGGAERGTLNIILAGVNVGKSLGLCSLAADYLQQGLNVLYITMEMAEHVCAKRIDANLLDVSLDDIDDNNITYADYQNKMEAIGKRKIGRLIIKQYPTGGASVSNFRALLNELKLKKHFKPDVIIVDYLAICASSRIRVYSENSYTLVKAVAEELRGLAVEENAILWTGAQTTRSAWDATDVSMADTAESAGLPATADFMVAVIETDELAQQGIQVFKQIKSRYGDKNKWQTFEMGVKKANQRWYAIDNGKDYSYNVQSKVNEQPVQTINSELAAKTNNIDEITF
ncbi:DnaB-like replicative helicase [Morganella phage vB_Mm5]